jgi:hypothetical protein
MMMSNGNLDDYSITQWASMVGHWETDRSGTAKYLGPQADQRPFGICISNVRFAEGEVRIAVCGTDGEVDGRVLLGYQSLESEYFVIGIGGYGDAYTITHFHPISGWTRIRGVGRKENLTIGKEYQVAVRVDGQRISLEIDGVGVIDHTLERSIPYGKIGLFAWGAAGGIKFSGASISRRPSDIEQVVILVHGIRTHAEWQKLLHKEFSRVGIVVASTNYGYFDLVRFLLPVPTFRRKAIDQLWEMVRTVRRDYPRAKLSFLAHSFGTYLVAHLLKREFDFKADRIVFCGGIVPYNFPFNQISERFTAPIVNEVSARDPWPVIAQNITFGYGAVGTRGFNRPQIRDRWHRGFGHSKYLTQTFCEAFWVPFFDKGKVVEGRLFQKRPPGGVACCSFLQINICRDVSLWD